jgi:tetratricopeptide (TPR) repeat protein
MNPSRYALGPARALLLLALLSCSVFAVSLGGGFVWDDHEIVERNPLFTEARNLPRIFLAEDRFEHIATGYYRPATYLTFYLEHRIWGDIPLGFHLTNVLLHAGVVGLFYLLVLRMTGAGGTALLAGALLAVHPMVAEPVSFLAGGRNTLLAALAMLGAFLLHLQGRRRLALAAFTVSIFAKEFGLLLPVLLFLYDRLTPGRRAAVREYLPYAAPAAVYLALRSYAVGGIGGTGVDFDPAGLGGRLALIPELYARYIGLFLMPWGVRVPYDIAMPSGFGIGGAASWAAFALALAGLAFAVRDRLVRFGLLWFALFLFPVSGIVPFWTILMADRYAYFSLMGLALGAAVLLAKVRARLFAPLLLMVLAAALGAMSAHRATLWRDDLTLYTTMAREAPAHPLGYTSLGYHHLGRNDLGRARRYLELAVAAQGEPPARETSFMLATVTWEQGDCEAAIRLLGGSRDVQGMALLQRCYAETGDEEKAAAYREGLLARMPQYDRIFAMRGEALERGAREFLAVGDTRAARVGFERSLRYNPESIDALRGLAGLLDGEGEIAASAELRARAEAIEAGSGAHGPPAAGGDAP